MSVTGGGAWLEEAADGSGTGACGNDEAAVGGGDRSTADAGTGGGV